MSTTLRQLSELIIRRLAGGDPKDDFRWDEREIMISIGQVRDQLVKEELFKMMGAGEKTIPADLLSIFKNVAVAHDDDLDLYYSTLPAKYVSLPHDKGLWHVSLMKDQINVFYRRPQGGNSIYGKLEGSDFAGNIGFWVESDRIYYINLPLGEEPCSVLIKMVAKTQDIDPDDPLPVTSDLEARISDIVFRMYAQQLPKDIVNDSEDARTNQ